jgi:hypothetical protein
VREAESFERDRVDGDDHAGGGHRDRANFRPQDEPERFEDAPAIGIASEL